jgi:hypothetical protein
MITSFPSNKSVMAILATSSADKTVCFAIPVNLMFASFSLGLVLTGPGQSTKICNPVH